MRRCLYRPIDAAPLRQHLPAIIVKTTYRQLTNKRVFISPFILFIILRMRPLLCQMARFVFNVLGMRCITLIASASVLGFVFEFFRLCHLPAPSRHNRENNGLLPLGLQNLLPKARSASPKKQITWLLAIS